MADTNTGADAAEQTAAPAAEGNENSPTNSQPADQNSGGDAAGDEEGDDGGDEGGEGDDADDDTFEDDGADPSVRRDNSYFVGLRHGKKAAKQGGKPVAGGDDDGGEDDGDDDEGGIHPEDAEILNSAIGNAIKPITDKLAASEDATALNSFIAQNPAFKPYQAKIERFMKHPTRSHLPIDTVAMEAVGTAGMIKIGAKMARTADHKKNSSKTGAGNGPRQAEAKADVWGMSDTDFTSMQNSVRSKA